MRSKKKDSRDPSQTVLGCVSALILVAQLLGCSSQPASVQEPLSVSDTFLLIVGYANRPDQVLSAEVTAVTSRGMALVATTDRTGVAEIQRSVLAESSVLLVCSQGFFCGALLVEEEDLLEFNQYYIELTPQAFL